MKLLYCDLEIYSEAPITHGTHKNAEAVEALLWSSVNKDDQEQDF